MKLKTLGQIAAALGHNERRREQEHADNRTPLMGGGVRRVGGSDDPVQALKDRLEETATNPRKGAVLALEFVASASPEWFQAASRRIARAGFRTRHASSPRRWGVKTTSSPPTSTMTKVPHIYILSPSPSSRRSAAGSAGSPSAQLPSRRRSRSCRGRWQPPTSSGTGKKLTALQTDYADAVAGWGLHRGRPRALTNARHKSPAQYRAEVAQHAAREKTSLERATVEQMRELSDAMAEGFRAVDDGRLRYQPPRDGAPATIAPGACAPSGTAWDRLTARIRPGLVPVLQYAKATARLVIREQEVAQREEEVITDAGKLLDMAGRVALLEHLPSSSRAEARVAQKIAQLFRGRER